MSPNHSLSGCLLFPGRAFDLAGARAARHFVLAAVLAVFDADAGQQARAERTQFFFDGAQGVSIFAL
jgi:hypothetical protein